MRFGTISEGSRVNDRPEDDDQGQVADQRHGNQSRHSETQSARPTFLVRNHFVPLSAKLPWEPQPVLATFPCGEGGASSAIRSTTIAGPAFRAAECDLRRSLDGGRLPQRAVATYRATIVVSKQSLKAER